MSFRNKLAAEFWAFKAAWWDTRKGWRHDWTDLHVEFLRHFAYTLGHLLQFWPLLVLWLLWQRG